MSTILKGVVTLKEVATQIGNAQESFYYNWFDGADINVKYASEKLISDRSLRDFLPQDGGRTRQLYTQCENRYLLSRLTPDAPKLMAIVVAVSSSNHMKYDGVADFLGGDSHSPKSIPPAPEIITAIWDVTRLEDAIKGITIPSKEKEFEISTEFEKPYGNYKLRKPSNEPVSEMEFFTQWKNYLNGTVVDLQRRLN